MSFLMLLCWQAMAQPANDDISGAIQLTVGAGSCTSTTSGTTVAATNSGVAHTCANYQGGDVWYYVIVPAGGTFSVEGTANGGFTDGGMQAYSGPSNALVSINCDDDDSPSGNMPGIYPADGLTGLTPGDTIWFAIWEYGDDAPGTFDICAWSPPPAPANDDISGAIALTLGTGSCSTPLSGTNVSATNSGVAHSCASYQGGDVWYYVVVPAAGTFTVETSTNGGFTDGGMQAYSGPSNSLVSIDCDDDDSPSGLMPAIYPTDGLTGLTPGDTIWFAVWEYGNNVFGTFEICAWGPPACPDPTALTVTNVTTTSADLGWTDPTGSLWHIEWDTAGFTQGTGNFINNTTTNPQNVTGLTANTNYEFYVISDCGVDSSAWAGPFAFNTACASVMAPWNEDFENSGTIPSCWNQGTSNSESWIFSTTGGHVGNAGSFSVPTTSGNYFAYVDDSTPDNTGTTLESPYIDVSGLTVPELSFFLISNNEGNSNVNFSVDVWDGAAWNTGVYTSNTNTLNGDWEKIIVSLASLTITGDIQLRFIVDEPSNGDFYDDVAIDDVDIHEAPNCPDPTMLTITNLTSTSADLGWTDPTGSLWDIEWDTAGFTQGAGNFIIGTTTNPHNLTGLTPNTNYEFYVRTDCGVDSSNWVGPFPFFTGYCQVVSTSPSSYMDDFSTTGGSTNISNLTSGYATNGYEDATVMVVSQFAGASFNFNTQFIGTTVGYNIWVDWNNDLDFDDPGEDVYLSGGYVSSASGTITVPAATPVGNYRMRMRCDYNATSPNACGPSGSGRNETEDYTIAVVAQQANDIGVIAIESAPTGCGLGNETVTIKVKNFGTAAQTGFDVAYALNSVAITPETVSATVNPGDTLTYVFTTLANMSTSGAYTIDAWTDLTTDGDNNNDTLNGWMTEHLASSLAFSGNMAIPDNDTEGINSIICTNGLVNNMLDSCYTLSALVIDSLTHTFNGDLDIWLISPANDTLEVSTDNGGSTDNYINVTFTDTASVNINGNNPVPGFYHTEELAGLAKFNGTNPEGAWTLLVKDDAGGDLGVLYDWHLEFTDHNFTVNLGVDTNLCPNQSITLDAGAGNYTYAWSTGDNTQQVTLDTNTLGGNGTYNIVVTVTDTLTGCATIDTIVVDFSPCAGINALANNVNVNVYPNPNNGQFTLNVNTTDVNELSIKVINLQGQEVYNRNNFDNLNTVNEQIDLNDRANGIYFVIVTTDKGSVTHKMIIQ